MTRRLRDYGRGRLFRLLRLPNDPSPPSGAPGTVRVFHAARNYYWLRLARWALTQVGALIGILFSLTFLSHFERGIEAVQHEIARVRAAEAQAATAGSDAATLGAADGAAKIAPAPQRPPRQNGAIARLARRSPTWVVPILKALEAIGVAVFVIQIPLTFAITRLDYSLRWYMVTDRSLRIRSGVTTLLESTMSFANVQQVTVSQGPLQRLLGLADLRVTSAGGGADNTEEDEGDSLHGGVFHGVGNADEIRDLILERLRAFRESGLGDPDETNERAATAVMPASAPAAIMPALQELRTEARALREFRHARAHS